LGDQPTSPVSISVSMAQYQYQYQYQCRIMVGSYRPKVALDLDALERKIPIVKPIQIGPLAYSIQKELH